MLSVSQSVRPLIFLWVRSFINGIKRAFSSPQRLIGVLLFCGYWARLVIAPFYRAGNSDFSSFRSVPRLSLPPIEAIDAVVFTAFAAMSILFMASVMGFRGSFRPADVDVLFPTPVSPKVVMLFRILRDYFVTLLMPLFFVILGGSNSSQTWQHLFANFPREGSIVGRSAMAAWILMSLAWVSLGYGVSMFVNRSDLQSDRNKKIIGYSIGAVVVVALLFVSIRLRMDHSLVGAREIANSLLLRILIAPASAATAMVIGPLSNNLLAMFVGAASLVAIGVLGQALAFTQIEFLYDQAAAKGFGSTEMKNLQRSGDTYGVIAEQARRGKYKISRLTRWWGSLRFTGGPALMWKEILLVFRGGAVQFVLFIPVILFLSWMPIWASGPQFNANGTGVIYLGMQAFGSFLLGFGGSQMAFIEMLRRVDFQKPLPFTPTVTVFWETAARVLPSIVAVLISAIGVMILRAELWPFVTASLFGIPSVTLVITAVTLMVTVLFPDYEDPTQRGFRGLMQMLGVLIALLPGLGVAVGLFFLKANPILVALPVVGINLGMTALFCTLAGNLYANYNPSE